MGDQPILADLIKRYHALKARTVEHSPLRIHLFCGICRTSLTLQVRQLGLGCTGVSVGEQDRAFHNRLCIRCPVRISGPAVINGRMRFVVRQALQATGGRCMSRDRQLDLRPTLTDLDPLAGLYPLCTDHFTLGHEQPGDLSHHLQAHGQRYDGKNVPLLVRFRNLWVKTVVIEVQILLRFDLTKDHDLTTGRMAEDLARKRQGAAVGQRR